MNNKYLIVLAMVILCFIGKTMAFENPQRAVASISGNYFRAIELALPEIIVRKLDLARYEVTVFENTTSLIILFASPKRQQGERGNLSGDQPALEVEILKKTNTVVRANYVR